MKKEMVFIGMFNDTINIYAEIEYTSEDQKRIIAERIFNKLNK